MSTKTQADKSVSDRENRARWESFAFAVARPEPDGKVNVANHSHEDARHHTYTVTVTEGEAVGCTCPDATYRDRTCKHQMAVTANEPVMQAVSGAVRTDGGEEDTCWCEEHEMPCLSCVNAGRREL